MNLGSSRTRRGTRNNVAAIDEMDDSRVSLGVSKPSMRARRVLRARAETIPARAGGAGVILLHPSVIPECHLQVYVFDMLFSKGDKMTKPYLFNMGKERKDREIAPKRAVNTEERRNKENTPFGPSPLSPCHPTRFQRHISSPGRHVRVHVQHIQPHLFFPLRTPTASTNGKPRTGRNPDQNGQPRGTAPGETICASPSAHATARDRSRRRMTSPPLIGAPNEYFLALPLRRPAP